MTRPYYVPRRRGVNRGNGIPPTLAVEPLCHECGSITRGHAHTCSRLSCPESRCAACGKPAEGNFSIHRDGFCEGPEVSLCNACGRAETPTCEELWDRIAARAAPNGGPAQGGSGTE